MIIILISILFNYIITEDDTTILIKSLNETIQKIEKKLPSTSDTLIRNMMGITDLISDSFERNNPEMLKDKYPFIPLEVIDKFGGLKFSDTVTINKFSDFIQNESGRGILFIAAAKWDGSKINFVYTQADIHGDLVKNETCTQIVHEKKILFIVIKKWTETVCRPPDYTSSEILVIHDSLEYQAMEGIKNKFSNTNSNTEFIMTQSVSLNSLAGNAVCKLMENGQLFIGNKNYSTNLTEAQKFAKLLGRPQNKENGPFSLELSITKEEKKFFEPIIKEFDEDGNEIKNAKFLNFFEIKNEKEEEIIDSIGSKIIEVTNIHLVDKNRRIYFQLKAPIGLRPYRLTMLETNVLLLSDYDWTPIYDSGKLYVNKVDAFIPQGYRFYSKNNNYYAHLSNSGRLGIYKTSKFGKDETEIWKVDKYDDIEGPYNLLVAKDGEIKIENYKNIVTWRSGKKGKITGTKKLVVTDDGKIQIVDISRNIVIFDSSEYIFEEEEEDEI